MEPPFKLLLVEDDPAVGKSLRTGLEQEGYMVTWKETGAEGMDHARRYTPHLIILDVRLPDFSGLDVCRQLRQSGLLQPIIMLTACSEEVDKVLGLEMGADDYVTKPFGLRELISRIRAQLRRAYGEFSAADADVLYAGDLVINCSRVQVRRGDQIIDLTPTEFRLLTYLARHPGQALSRAQILDTVWGYAPDVESEQTISVYIRRLREKVEIDPSHPQLILTVLGTGYKLAS
jgi:DNA-binding response OmpR family regulator